QQPNETCGESVPRILHLACTFHRIFRHIHQYQFVKVIFSPCLSPNSSGVHVHTDATGRFSFVPQTESCSFVALHVGGYAEFTQDELDKVGTVTLQPWGRWREW
ncbi:MAG: hypothetical protein ACLQNE_47310, partial [Thermoguttaceae bacterium]